MATFDEIKATMSDSGAKHDKAIDTALSMLPLRVVMMMDATEAGRFVQNVHNEGRRIYMNATR